MNCKEQCFGCHGLYDVNDDIANSRRSSLDALDQDPEVESRMSPPFEISMICTKSRMTHPCVGIVLSFVFSDVRRNTMIRGTGDSLYYYLWICCIHR